MYIGGEFFGTKIVQLAILRLDLVKLFHENSTTTTYHNDVDDTQTTKIEWHGRWRF